MTSTAKVMARAKPSVGQSEFGASNAFGMGRKGLVPLGAMSEMLAPLYALVQPMIDQSDSGVIIHFVGMNVGEGVTSVSREFGHLAATKGGRRTLLLDGSLDVGAAAEGVVDRVARGVDYGDLLSPLNTSELYVGRLSAQGSGVPQESGAIQSTYESLRGRFELTVIDCPAITSGLYPNLAPDAADGIVLVVKAESERLVVLQHAKDLVEGAGGKFLAAVLNRRKNYIPGFLYKLL